MVGGRCLIYDQSMLCVQGWKHRTQGEVGTGGYITDLQGHVISKFYARPASETNIIVPIAVGTSVGDSIAGYIGRVEVQIIIASSVCKTAVFNKCAMWTYLTH